MKILHVGGSGGEMEKGGRGRKKSSGWRWGAPGRPPEASTGSARSE